MKFDGLRKRLCGSLMLAMMLCGGCKVTKQIVNLSPPPEQPPLQQLESHLNYVDPDAGQPDYRRDD